MRWLLAISFWAALLFPPLLSAQAGPVGHPSEAASNPAVRGFLNSRSQAPVISTAGGAYSIVSAFRNDTRAPFTQPLPTSLLPPGRRADWRHHLRDRHSGGSSFVFFNPWSFGYPYGYSTNYDPSMFYPSLWLPLDQQYLQAWQIAHGDVGGEVASQENELLSNRVQSLSSEVENLRQGAAAQAPAPAAPAPSRKTVATIFVYRDGRSLEAHDYAIFNQTLWIFGSETTRRIPLSEINLPATLKLNESRGVDVSLPKNQ